MKKVVKQAKMTRPPNNEWSEVKVGTTATEDGAGRRPGGYRVIQHEFVDDDGQHWAELLVEIEATNDRVHGPAYRDPQSEEEMPPADQVLHDFVDFLPGTVTP